MRLDELPRSENVEDRRSYDGGASFRIPGGRSGLGIGTIIVLGLVGYWLGIDPSVLIGGAEILTGGGSSQQQSYPGPRDSAGARDTGAPSDQMGQFVSAVLGSTEAQWQKIFAQYGKTYEPPTLVMFSGVTRSACGFDGCNLGGRSQEDGFDDAGSVSVPASSLRSAPSCWSAASPCGRD